MGERNEQCNLCKICSFPSPTLRYPLMDEPASKRRRQEFEHCRKVLSLIDQTNINYASKFAILKITECNASQKCCFSEAKCNVVMAGEKGYPFYLEILDIFSKGGQLLNNFQNDTQFLDENEERAISILDDYFKDIEFHEKSLHKVISTYDKKRDKNASEKERDENSTERKRDEKTPELDLTLAFAEHLLGKLAPGQSYTVNTHVKMKRKCTCGLDHCQSDPQYGGTGLGDVNAWHGFMDIVIGSHYGLLDSVGVGVTVSTADSHDIEEEDTDDSDCLPCGKGNSGVRSEDQVVAQTIVYSFIQRNLHPEHQTLIPNILISSSHFRIIMYDSVQDVLLCTATIPLFRTNMTEKLIPEHVIILWMVLHYRMFCSGIKQDWIGNMDKIRLNFKDLAKDKYNVYVNLSHVGIQDSPEMTNSAYPTFESFCGGIHLDPNK